MAISLAILLTAASLLADEPVPIQFPDSTSQVVPVQPAVDSSKVNMRFGECYVVAHPTPLLVYACEDGVVQVSYRPPSTAEREMWFVPPGSGRAIWSTYPAGLHLYLITPSSEGSVTVLFAQSLDASAVQRRTFIVSGGGPQPPPAPNPPTPPTPVPTPPKPVPGSLRVVMVSDETDAVPARLAATSINTRMWLDANCVKIGQLPAWRLYDRDALSEDDLSEEDPTLRRLVQQTRPLWPAGPICIAAVGNDAKVFSIQNTDQLINTLKEIVGAK